MSEFFLIDTNYGNYLKVSLYDNISILNPQSKTKVHCVCILAKRYIIIFKYCMMENYHDIEIFIFTDKIIEF